MKTYQILARSCGARNSCTEKNNLEWKVKHQERIDELVSDFPHGSGFDSGTQLDCASTPEKLIFNTAFHHMDENGYYDGWTEHQVIVTPCLQFGYSIRITGRNRNEIKDHIHETFDCALSYEQPEHKPLLAVPSVMLTKEMYSPSIQN